MGYSPTWRKTRKLGRIKGRGAVSTCVTTPIILPGPTNPWALHLPDPPCHVAPLGCPRGLVWPLPCVRATLHHVGSSGSAMWPCVPRRTRRGSPTPRQLHGVCGKLNPLFRNFNYKITLIKSIKIKLKSKKKVKNFINS